MTTQLSTLLVRAAVLVFCACSGTPSAAPTDANLADDAGVDAPPGPWPAFGARLTGMLVVTSCLVEERPQPYDPQTVILRARPAGTGAELRLGRGRVLSDGGLDYDFIDQLGPPTVVATLGPPQGGYRPFATTAPVTWTWDFLAAQAPLPLRRLLLTGTLDPNGVPTSDQPSFAGTLAGCVSPPDAEAIVISVLGKTLRELLDQCPLDCDATGAGAVDSWTISATWEAAEVVALSAPGVADGG